MDIVIVSQYLRNIEDLNNNNSRFVYLAKLLSKNKKNNIEIITSDFSHSQKKHFSKVGHIDNIKITVCHEPGYQKNVSLKRFYSHKILSKNVKKYLTKRQKPDIVYSSVPSLDVAKVCADYCHDNCIKFIVDIQDLWPEAFKMVLKIPVISDIVFYPMLKKENYIYSRADKIVAVSKTYAIRGMKSNKKAKEGISVYLGTELDFFDKYVKKSKTTESNNNIKIAYIGTLGTSYDIEKIIDAIKILNDKKINNIEFVVIGDGPLKSKFEKYAKENKIKYKFTGKLEYPKMIGELCSCDIAVNPIIGTSAASIINKVGDYAAASLPVINTQNSIEYKKLIDNYNAGFNCENENPEDIANKLERLIKNKKLREKMGKGNRKMAEEKFDRKKTYIDIVNVINGVMNDKKNC